MIPENILHLACESHVTLVMGATDTGKTTTTTILANHLFRQGYSVGIIDTDVGQSDIGPPTTIGLGLVKTPLDKLSEAELQQLYFVGSTSPKGNLLPMVIGARKLLDAANTLGVGKILLNTTGLIDGQLGRVLKEHKIAAVNPDLILCLQRQQECEHILKVYASFERPKIIRLAPDPRCRRKNSEERRQYRETLLSRYFSTAHDWECSLETIGVFGTSLLSGKPCLAQQLQKFSACLNATPPSPPILPTNRQAVPSGINVIWGESLGTEIHLVTSRQLAFQEIDRLKSSFPDVRYIKDYLLDEFENMVVGVLNVRHECCGLGVLRSIDFFAKRAIVHTTIAPKEIAGVIFSRYALTV